MDDADNGNCVALNTVKNSIRADGKTADVRAKFVSGRRAQRKIRETKYRAANACDEPFRRHPVISRDCLEYLEQVVIGSRKIDDPTHASPPRAAILALPLSMIDSNQASVTSVGGPLSSPS